MSTAGVVFADPTSPTTRRNPLRRIIIISTAIAVLIGASAAYASFNNYSASFRFSPTKAGSTKSPVPVGFTQTYNAFGTNGDLAAPLTDIKTSIYGLKADAKDFPTCSASKISALKSDSFCPKKALVAQGPVNSTLVPSKTPKGPGSPCNPYLHVWNGGVGKGGVGKVTFFFVIIPSKGYSCGALTTGAAAPYFGTVKQHGKYLVTDVFLPPDVSTQAAGLKGIYGALTRTVLHWAKLTTRVKGKTVAYQESFGCQGGKRPWSMSFKATNFPTAPGGTTSTKQVSGSANCTK
jgi:hypothetical protein